jgi:Na+/H+ antiporter NhaD/arsenite permease-like protein
MGSWQAIVALTIFGSVIGIIIMEWLPLAITAMLGALLLVVLNILTLDRAISYIRPPAKVRSRDIIDQN